jgi:hypothetical protein
MGSSRKRVQLIHWNADEAASPLRLLGGAGFDAAHELPWNPAAEKRLRADPPAAVVIDLTRLPSQGRDWGIALRSYESMLRVPLLFVEGDASNHERIRKIAGDLNQTIVRKAGLDAGLVDFRISRIDATWAGLHFTI